MKPTNQKLTQDQIDSFHQQGYLVIPNWCDERALENLNQAAIAELSTAVEPIEREGQTGYPGAPSDINQPGGQTPRRLLGAYQRQNAWKEFATNASLKNCLSQLFSDDEVYLSQVHHNCLMTKHPEYSSDTGWHQDFRYWSFAQPNLISAWCALGKEQADNGGLQVIPKTHLMRFEAEQFDERQFFRADFASNQALLEQVRIVQLNPGDLLFFHCNLLHAATRNYSQAVKMSLVFTYHSSDNAPIANTRSSSLPEIALR